MFGVFEICVIPPTKAFDGLLQDSGYRLVIDVEPLIYDLALDNEDTAGFAGFNLHSCPSDVSLEFVQQAFGACVSRGYGRHVIHVCPDWRKSQPALQTFTSNHPSRCPNY